MCAGLAQLVEHLICNQGVGSSSLSAGTIHPQEIRIVRNMPFLRPAYVATDLISGLVTPAKFCHASQ